MAQMISWFAEEARRNQNPNFINNMKPEDIAKQVRRIIKDIQRNIITDNDYMYFNNPKLISVCIAECRRQWSEVETIKTSLDYAQRALSVSVIDNTCLPAGMDANEYRINIANLLKKYTNAAGVWSVAYFAFMEVDAYNRNNCNMQPQPIYAGMNASTGMDMFIPPIKVILSRLCSLDKALFYDM